MALPDGTRIGSFEILGSIGAGGMGEVYRAVDHRLGREVALKVLQAELMNDRERLLRFVQEARAASALNHRNIVTIYEIGQAAGQPFLAMELIDGRTLRELLDGGPVPLRKTLDIAAQITEGLAAAHESQIVHRDLKPENMMISRDGNLKILDFGLAKPFGAGSADRLGGQQAKTETGFVLGTPGYMSPEQASGRSLDFRSDQFSVGLILYEMLTGRRAFERGTAVQTLSAIIQEDPEPVEKLNPRVPQPLLWIIERCIAKDPDDRYLSTRDLSRELRQIRDNLGKLTESVSEQPEREAGKEGGPTRRTVAPLGPARAAAAVSPPPESVGRRLVRIAGTVFAGLLLLAAGGSVGFWLRGTGVEEPPQWRGEMILGDTTPVLASRVSPDGQTLAFVTMVAGASQIAVMKPSSGDWSVLTKKTGAGSVYRPTWSPDGARIFFDRVTDVPHGIFSVPAVGGEERLVLENAQSPEMLPDGSLLVARTAKDGNLQLQRFWPENGRIVPVGPAVLPESLGLPVRVSADGHRAIFWGRVAGETAGERPRMLHWLDLESGATRPVSSDLPLAPPFCPAADGDSILATLSLGDLHRIVSVSRDGSVVKGLLSLTQQPRYLSTGPGGSLYVGLVENVTYLMRFGVAGGIPERLAATGRVPVSSPLELPDGRFLVPGLVAGRHRLLVRSPDGEMRPLVDTSEETSAPVARLDSKRLVFLAGPPGAAPSLVVASAAEGRILERIAGSTRIAPQELAVSTDGRTLFYTDRGVLWALELPGGKAPRRLGAGNGVAVHPNGLDLLVQRNRADGVKLFVVPLRGGSEYEVPFLSALRLTPAPISGRAIGPDGRVVVTVASSGSFNWGPAVLDLGSGRVERVPVSFEGDVLATTWTQDGMLLAMGVEQRSELWRFRPAARTTGPPGSP